MVVVVEEVLDCGGQRSRASGQEGGWQSPGPKSFKESLERQTERETDRQRETETDRERQTENTKSNSKRLILKDSSIQSIWTSLTVSPCYTTNTNKHDYTTNG